MLRQYTVTVRNRPGHSANRGATSRPSQLPSGRRNLRIGLLIKELRLEKGMTQDQLAREIRTPKSAISRLENHAESITLATLEKVAHALGKVVHIELS